MTAARQNRERWDLSLFVAGKDHPNSRRAYANLVRICEEHLSGEYHLDVVDITERPDVAASEQLLALPTLVRRQPKPTRRIIGDLGDTDRVLVSLGVKAVGSAMLSA